MKDKHYLFYSEYHNRANTHYIHYIVSAINTEEAWKKAREYVIDDRDLSIKGIIMELNDIPNTKDWKQFIKYMNMKEVI